MISSGIPFDLQKLLNPNKSERKSCESSNVIATDNELGFCKKICCNTVNPSALLPINATFVII